MPLLFATLAYEYENVLHSPKLGEDGVGESFMEELHAI